MEQRGKRVLWTAASVVLVPAAAGATWWLAGDLTTSNSPDPSYAIRPPHIEPAVARTTGLVLTLVVATYWLVFVLSTRSSRSTVFWLPVVASLTLAGAFIGYSARVVTAGVDGANIGAGLLLLGGPFVLLALLGFPILRARTLVHGPTKAPAWEPPPGWYADPEHPDRWRWWNGQGWAPSLPSPHQS